MADKEFQSQFQEQTLFDAFVNAAGKYESKHPALEDAIGQKFSFGRVLIGARILGQRFAKITEPGEYVAVSLPSHERA